MTRAAFVLLALGFALVTGCGRAEAAPAPSGWTSFDQGAARAAREKKPMVVDVYTDWCGVCKKMDADTFADPVISKRLAQEFVAVKFNAEDEKGRVTFQGRKYSHPEFTQKAGVEGFPTILFFDEKGEFITGLPGYANAKMFGAILDYIKEGAYKKKIPFDEFLKSRKA